MKKLKDKLKDYRQSGLSKDGEFSYENLVFKFLRRSGHIEKLFDIAKEIFGAERTFMESDLQSAVTYAMEQATLLNQVSEGSHAVLITGSVVTVGEAKKIVNKIGSK